MDELLNSDQKNSLRALLLVLEENLRQAQEWLDGREEDGVLCYRRLNISEQAREQANQAVEKALRLIERVSNEFGLEKGFQSAASVLQGNLAADWVNLVDSKSNKLRRHGQIHPELSDILDLDIQNLAEITWYLATIFGQSK